MRHRHIAISLRAGGALLAVGAFVTLTHDLVESDVDAIDRALLLAIATARRGWLCAGLAAADEKAS